MRYKVGDKVKVRSDLVAHGGYDGYTFIEEKVGHLRGKTITIEKVDYDTYYSNGWLFWTDAMFEIEQPFFKTLPDNFSGCLEVRCGVVIEKTECIEILDSEEKEYLQNVINLVLKDKNVISIRKNVGAYEKYIQIMYAHGSLALPPFKSDMYKGMNKNQVYTLKELGLKNKGKFEDK